MSEKYQKLVYDLDVLRFVIIIFSTKIDVTGFGVGTKIVRSRTNRQKPLQHRRAFYPRWGRIIGKASMFFLPQSWLWLRYVIFLSEYLALGRHGALRHTAAATGVFVNVIQWPFKSCRDRRACHSVRLNGPSSVGPTIRNALFESIQQWSRRKIGELGVTRKRSRLLWFDPQGFLRKNPRIRWRCEDFESSPLGATHPSANTGVTDGY